MLPLSVEVPPSFLPTHLSSPEVEAARMKLLPHVPIYCHAAAVDELFHATPIYFTNEKSCAKSVAVMSMFIIERNGGVCPITYGCLSVVENETRKRDNTEDIEIEKMLIQYVSVLMSQWCS